MKTNLNRAITSVADAKSFLKELYDNSEVFHPEDDASDVDWCGDKPSEYEITLLNTLMDCVWVVAGPEFDPCEYVLDLYNSAVSEQ